MNRHGVLTTAALIAFTMISSASSSAAAQTDEDPWLGPDKALHFSASAALAGGGYGFGALFFEDYAPRFLLGAGIALLAGAAKELIDLAGAGDASWRDVTWDIIGTATGLLVAWLIDWAIRGLPPWDSDAEPEAPQQEGGAESGSGGLGFVRGLDVTGTRGLAHAFR